MTPPSSSSSPSLSAPATKHATAPTRTMTMPDPSHDAVRLDYLRSLTELKDTTRPAIVSLTTIAHESMAFAPAIVAAIVERSLSVRPTMVKLPIMYLIDSILKNLGGPYIQLFTPVIVRVYQDAFLASDERSRHSLLKVLNTWRNPPHRSKLDAFVRSVPRPVAMGLPAFPAPPAPAAMFPSIATQPGGLGAMVPAAGVAGFHAPPMSPTTTVISELNLLVEARTARKATNPLDLDNAQKLDALIQLRTMVLTGQIPPDQLLVVRSTVSQLTQEFVAAQQVQAAALTPTISVPSLSLPLALPATVTSTSTPPPAFGIPTTTTTLASSGAAPLNIASLPASELAALASALLPGIAKPNALPSPPSSVSGAGQPAGPADVQAATVKDNSQFPRISISSSGYVAFIDLVIDFSSPFVISFWSILLLQTITAE
ncbi:hypothetical protein BCR44DRAFT_1424953 [Catenaria anguillulae PL171]|uniref:CID domain-containing protein n=1 Tax=Catenaria anguillulae PL171 TaxID=765915 RepID=A0A1Y2I0M5_9FUNG|nr:hypothetical protein BCR44DRAFT_1424953 [Catenaria anguillulae PL171]